MAGNMNAGERYAVRVEVEREDKRKVTIWVKESTKQCLENADEIVIARLQKLANDCNFSEDTCILYEDTEDMAKDSAPIGLGSSSTCSTPSNSVWDIQKTRELLSKYKDMKQIFNNPAVKNKRIWEEITNYMNTRTQSNFSNTQVEGRWKTVLAHYRRFKDSQKQTGEGKKSFEYEREMDDILGKSHSTTPTFLFASSASSASTSSSSNNQDNIGSDSEEDQGTAKRKAKEQKRNEKKRKRVSGASQMISFLEKYTESVDESRKRQEKRHEEQMNLLKSLTTAITKIAENK